MLLRVFGLLPLECKHPTDRDRCCPIHAWGCPALRQNTWTQEASAKLCGRAHWPNGFTSRPPPCEWYLPRGLALTLGPSLSLTSFKNFFFHFWINFRLIKTLQKWYKELLHILHPYCLNVNIYHACLVILSLFLMYTHTQTHVHTHTHVLVLTTPWSKLKTLRLFTPKHSTVYFLK